MSALENRINQILPFVFEEIKKHVDIDPSKIDVTSINKKIDETMVITDKVIHETNKKRRLILYVAWGIFSAINFCLTVYGFTKDQIDPCPTILYNNGTLN